MSSPRHLNFSFGISDIMDDQTKAFAKENNLTLTQADMHIWQATQTKAYREYALNNAKSSAPSLLERHKFALLLTGKLLKEQKQTEVNVSRSISNISPM
jgi:hypothetical protein